MVYINTESQIEKIDKRLRQMSYYRAKADKPYNIADARCLQQTFFDNIYLDIVRHYVCFSGERIDSDKLFSSLSVI